MCGIFFSAGFDAPKECITSVEHRGPDALSWTIEEGGPVKISLGHARLTIIDLSEAANQPFISDDKDYVLLFNGAIYNYLELRKELEIL